MNIKLILILLVYQMLGAQNYPKTKLRLFRQTNLFDSILVRNDSLLFFNVDTIYKTPFSQKNFWSLEGNSSTNPSTNFIGTLDNQRLVFKTNNTEHFTLSINGYLGLGTPTPSYKLEVKGQMKLDTTPLITTAQKMLVKNPSTDVISEQNTAYTLFLTASNEVSNTTASFVNITGLATTLDSGWYEIEFYPVYSVNATTTGTAFSFNGTGTISIYGSMGIYSNAATTSNLRFYANPNTEGVTANTSRTTNNIAKIYFKLRITTTGVFQPTFRAETAGQTVTIKEGSTLTIKKIN